MVWYDQGQDIDPTGSRSTTHWIQIHLFPLLRAEFLLKIFVRIRYLKKIDMINTLFTFIEPESYSADPCLTIELVPFSGRCGSGSTGAAAAMPIAVTTVVFIYRQVRITVLWGSSETGSKLLAGSGFYFFIWFLCALVSVFLEGVALSSRLLCRCGCVFLNNVSLSMSCFFMFLLVWFLIFFLLLFLCLMDSDQDPIGSGTFWPGRIRTRKNPCSLRDRISTLLMQNLFNFCNFLLVQFFVDYKIWCTCLACFGLGSGSVWITYLNSRFRVHRNWLFLCSCPWKL